MAYVEIDVDITVSPDKREMNIKLSGPLSIENVVMELEYLIHQFSKAEEDKAKPGVRDH